MRLQSAVIVQLILISSLAAQDPAVPGIRKNVISLETEQIIVAGNTTLNYERLLLPERNFRIGLKAGFGGYHHTLDEGGTLVIWLFDPPETNDAETYRNFICKFSVNLVWSGGFELGLGLSGMQKKTDSGGPYLEAWPIINLGYRKDFEWIQIRAYVGSWGIGFSMGFPF